jgi:hypothetical protein
MSKCRTLKFTFFGKSIDDDHRTSLLDKSQVSQNMSEVLVVFTKSTRVVLLPKTV